MNRETKLSGRGFRKEWTATRPWLEYSSSSADKVFCFPCHLFACHMSTSHVKGHEAFILAGYTTGNMLRKKTGFAQHETSEFTSLATTAYQIERSSSLIRKAILASKQA